MEKARAIVVIPTYNEAESLPATVAGILAEVPAASILIVDDASPDGTGDIADGLACIPLLDNLRLRWNSLTGNFDHRLNFESVRLEHPLNQRGFSISN